jgi:hypothetical protein
MLFASIFLDNISFSFGETNIIHKTSKKQSMIAFFNFFGYVQSMIAHMHKNSKHRFLIYVFNFFGNTESKIRLIQKILNLDFF